MYGSRRVWTIAAIGGVLAGLAVLLERPAPLVGAAAIAAWLLATQLLAVRAFERTPNLELTYATDRRYAAVEQAVRCRFVVEREPGSATTATRIEATATVPLAARGATTAERTVTLAPGETRAATTFDLTFPVAGRFEFGQPALTVTDALGLFGERLVLGDAPSVTVSAAGPRDIHVGQGGNRTLGAYGEHATDQRGAGLLPEELREYVPGDPADSIDWKATARLNELYVREFQVETDRETVLIVDHRATMGQGPGGETMLAYAREVALAIADSAVRASDPLGLYAVGDGGLTVRQPPSTASGNYAQIRTRLQALDVTERTTTPTPAAEPGRAHRTLQSLRDDESRFARTLTPFLEREDAYVRRLAGDPLFGAVRSFVADADSNQWAVIVTNDADTARLSEAVRLAAKRSAAVLVFVLPTVLFETDTDPDLEAGYERYLEFEEFRRNLDRIPRVTAFEVGPGDRIQRLLAARRARTGTGARAGTGTSTRTGPGTTASKSPTGDQ